MDILAFKPGHDGSIAFISGSQLIFSIEAEKDSYPRYSECHPNLFLNVLSKLDKIPGTIAISGWMKAVFDNNLIPLESGYFNSKSGNIISRKIKIFGKEVNYFSSSHIRSHVLSSLSMSELPQGERCYCLVWEGILGGFYEIDEQTNIIPLGNVIHSPGNKYSFIYSLADETCNSIHNTTAPGKVMALASFSNRGAYSTEEKELVDFLLSHNSLVPINKNDFKKFSLYNSGVESIEFKNFAGKFSDTIFDLFYDYAKKNLNKKLPLLISGGCGLNCEWNTKWKDSGLFSSVFVPPVPNDAGSAIGTAVDAMFHYTGIVKLNWDVYAGEEFINDEINCDNLEISKLDYLELARFLEANNVVAWIQGKYEIGPRALGNRSILASPLTSEMQTRLNKIKKRENYRPIAPICIEEDVSKHFKWQGASPYMLYFQQLRTDKLPAITHVDDTARVQTVNIKQNPAIYTLLEKFRSLTGFGVLCNTSLNFNGGGFINRRSDLLSYCKKNGLNGFVINDQFYKLI